jgi:hypothetical protein
MIEVVVTSDLVRANFAKNSLTSSMR